jgi:hypothetical protein
MFTMEAELATLDTTTVETDWFHELLMDLPIVEKPLLTILMNCNNQTKSSIHIKIRLKTIRKIRNSGVITLDYIHTEKNPTYPFTKGLSCNVIMLHLRRWV